MKSVAPFIVMGLFVIIQILYYLGVFRRLSNRFIPMILFLSLSVVTIVLAYLIG